MKRTITLIIVLAAMTSLTAQNSCGSVNDYDGNSYKTVKIGKQCWMAEWFQLFEFVGNQSEYLCGDSKNDIAKAMVLKERWNYSTSPCSAGDTLTENNATGFSAVPAGDANRLYSSYGLASFFWSASTSHFSKESQDYAEGYSIWHDETFYRYHGYDRRAGFSVRCLRD